ncbi:MAG: aspartate kinase [Desulfohalobiaceae bacterium]
MRIIVQKFGGTSVADLQCMRAVMAKVGHALERGYKAIVVVSAMAGETNRLLALTRDWSLNPDPAEVDTLLATGEQVSAALFSILLRDHGITARSVLGFQVPIRTDCAFGRARILGIDDTRLKAMLTDHDVLVVAGFQGWDEGQRLTTLGRGGSDTTAVALAAAVKAEVCEIYTDVDGVYTTDPNLCSQARKIKRITYDEMLEMASMGAKVLQIRSVEFAKKYYVPVLVRSTFSDATGTLVTKEDPSMEQVKVSGIAYDKDQARVTLREVPDRPGVAAAIFVPLADAGIFVDMIIQNVSLQGRTDMTFTVSRSDLERTLELLEKVAEDIGATEVMHDLGVCKVSVIGVGMRNHSGVAGTAFRALTAESINIMMISTSEIKISCVIEEKYLELAVRTLHDAFGLDQNPEV